MIHLYLKRANERNEGTRDISHATVRITIDLHFASLGDIKEYFPRGTRYAKPNEVILCLRRRLFVFSFATIEKSIHNKVNRESAFRNILFRIILS